MNTGIELRHLRHFVALAEELHFGRAARRCHISQPPFSVSIRQLEGALSVTLVERSSKEVRLTAAGRAYYEEALKVLRQVEQAATSADRAARGLNGTLMVGFFASMLFKGLSGAVRRFELEYPGVELKLLELSTAEQIPALLGRRIHYGFVHGAALPQALQSEPLVQEPFVLCLPADHEFATARRIELARLADEPFVIFSREFSPVYYDHVIAVCVSAGFHPRIRHEVRYWLTVLACVSRGLGVSIVPRSLSRAQLPGLAFVPIKTGIQSSVRGAWLAGTDPDPARVAWHRVVRRELAA